MQCRNEESVPFQMIWTPTLGRVHASSYSPLSPSILLLYSSHFCLLLFCHCIGHSSLSRPHPQPSASFSLSFTEKRPWASLLRAGYSGRRTSDMVLWWHKSKSEWKNKVRRSLQDSGVLTAAGLMVRQADGQVGGVPMDHSPMSAAWSNGAGKLPSTLASK